MLNWRRWIGLRLVTTKLLLTANQVLLMQSRRHLFIRFIYLSRVKDATAAAATASTASSTTSATTAHRTQTVGGILGGRQTIFGVMNPTSLLFLLLLLQLQSERETIVERLRDVSYEYSYNGKYNSKHSTLTLHPHRHRLLHRIHLLDVESILRAGCCGHSLQPRGYPVERVRPRNRQHHPHQQEIPRR